MMLIVTSELQKFFSSSIYNVLFNIQVGQYFHFKMSNKFQSLVQGIKGFHGCGVMHALTQKLTRALNLKLHSMTDDIRALHVDLKLKTFMNL